MIVDHIGEKSWELDEFVNYLDEWLIPDLKESGHTATAADFEVAVAFMTRLAALYKANRGFAKAAPGDIVNIGQSVETIRASLVAVLESAKSRDAETVLIKLDEQCPQIQQALKGILASLDKIADDNNLPR